MNLTRLVVLLSMSFSVGSALGEIIDGTNGTTARPNALPGEDLAGPFLMPGFYIPPDASFGPQPGGSGGAWKAQPCEQADTMEACADNEELGDYAQFVPIDMTNNGQCVPIGGEILYGYGHTMSWWWLNNACMVNSFSPDADGNTSLCFDFQNAKASILMVSNWLWSIDAVMTSVPVLGCVNGSQPMSKPKIQPPWLASTSKLFDCEDIRVCVQFNVECLCNAIEEIGPALVPDNQFQPLIHVGVITCDPCK